jgi:methyltransferase (TIGR00027 family)
MQSAGNRGRPPTAKLAYIGSIRVLCYTKLSMTMTPRSSADAAIRSVADTALWMAAVRADEGLRADAVFHDPLGSILAEERGRRIARSFSRQAMLAWGVVARTSAIDRLIAEVLQSGVDTVVNLGAGLDTRPYRMDLPPQMRWVEIDFPEIVELKNAKLAAYTPACRLERIGMDLLDRSARSEFFARYAAASNHVVVITEGVIAYFCNDDVALLAKELFAMPSMEYWIQDFDNAGRRPQPRGWAQKLKAAPFRFQVTDWFEFFKQCGWRPKKIITNLEESERNNRPYPFDFPFGLIMRALPREMTRKILSLSGVMLMDKAAKQAMPAIS